MDSIETIEKIKELYSKGNSIREIARRFNMSYGKVRNILIREGVKLRSYKVSKESEEKI